MAENRSRALDISSRDQAMSYKLAVGTGFRVNEIQSLQPESLNLNEDSPTVTVGAAYSERQREGVQSIQRELADPLRV